jgi:hypothetical protein
LSVREKESGNNAARIYPPIQNSVPEVISGMPLCDGTEGEIAGFHFADVDMVTLGFLFSFYNSSPSSPEPAASAPLGTYRKRIARPGLEGEAGEALSPLPDSDDPASGSMLDDEATDPAIAALRSKRESDKARPHPLLPSPHRYRNIIPWPPTRYFFVCIFSSLQVCSGALCV